MDIKKLIENLNRLTEEDMAEVNLQDTIEPDEPAEVVDEVPFTDTMSLADTLDAKTKIAKALENLNLAINEFKDATSEKIDLLKDEKLMQGIEGLDTQVKEIEAALAAGSNILGDSTLNDPFKADVPAKEEEIDEIDFDDEDEEDDEIDKEETEDEDEDEEDYDFDSEAGLDLIPTEEE